MGRRRGRGTLHFWNNIFGVVIINDDIWREGVFIWPSFISSFIHTPLHFFTHTLFHALQVVSFPFPSSPFALFACFLPPFALPCPFLSTYYPQFLPFLFDWVDRWMEFGVYSDRIRFLDYSPFPIPGLAGVGLEQE